MPLLEEGTRTRKYSMPFSEEQAKDCAHEALERLAKSRSARDRMLHAAAKKIGVEEVISNLSSKQGRVHKHFEATGRYLVTVDDLRRTIHGMRSHAEYMQDRDKRMSFARA